MEWPIVTPEGAEEEEEKKKSLKKKKKLKYQIEELAN